VWISHCEGKIKWAGWLKCLGFSATEMICEFTKKKNPQL
jgi:hypothetical protein